jgi:hypothetical protein
MAAETEAVSEKAKGFIPKCSPHTGIYSKMTLQNSFWMWKSIWKNSSIRMKSPCQTQISALEIEQKPPEWFLEY